MSIARSFTADISAVGRSESERLTFFERAWLLIGIVDITLAIDTYLMFHEDDSQLGAVAGLNISLTSFSIIALYWTWMSRAAVARRRSNVKFNFGTYMLFYISMVLVSVLVAINPLLTLFDVFLLAQSYLLFFYLANRIQHIGDLYFCVMCLAAAVLTQAVLIIGMYAVGAAWGQPYEIGPLMLSVSENGRAQGSMHSPILAGSTLALFWLPCVALLFCKRVSKLYYVAALAAVVLGLPAIFATGSRGAIASSFVAVILIAVSLLSRNWVRRSTLLLAFSLALLLLYPMYHSISKRFTDDQGSAISRVHLSEIAMEMILDEPILGYGAGNSHLAGQRYADQSKYRAEWYYTVHSKYLLVWIETGLLGLVFFLLVLGNGVWQGFSTWRAGHRSLAVLGIGISAALLGHMMHMLVDIFNSRTQVESLWVMLGLAAATWSISRAHRYRMTSFLGTKP